MSRQTAARIVWSLWAITVLSVVIGLWLLWSSGSTADRGNGGDPLTSLTFVTFVTIGALIVSRQPGNAIGWLLCAMGASVTWGMQGLGFGYVHYTLFGHPGALPAGEWVAWTTNWVTVLGLASVPLLFLLFPNGRLPSPRWAPVAWLTVLEVVISGIVVALMPGPLDNFPGVINPIGLPGLLGEVAAFLKFVSILLLGSLFLSGAGSVVARFRHAGMVERQQIKWFAFETALMATAFVATVFSHSVGPALDPDLANPLISRFTDFLWTLAVAGLPVTIGIAILHHRLYGIDLIIRRTLVYSALTAVLATVYFGGVVLLQQLLRAVAGQTSDLAIVGSTLVIAALVQPLRRHIQGAIDRRFFRRRYDAAKVLAAFGANLRDEVDLASLSARLLEVIEETMQPTHASLWLRARPDGMREERGLAAES